jgi:hypothetical protein
MSKRMVAAVAAAALFGAVGGYGMFAVKAPADTQRVSSRDGQVWTEEDWPFIIDQWGEGWSYQCKAADCGIDVSLYLRPKIGFCNCQTGVADDEELDRVSDLDLFGSEKSALGPGRQITVHWMKGRSRAYKVGAAAKPVLSLAFNNRCDVIVATVVAGKDPLAQERAVLDFLNGEAVAHWAEAVLGL